MKISFHFPSVCFLAYCVSLPLLSNAIDVTIQNPQNASDASDLENFLKNSLHSLSNEKRLGATIKLLNESGLFKDVKCLENSRGIHCDLVRFKRVERIQFRGIPLSLLQSDLTKKIPMHRGDVWPESIKAQKEIKNKISARVQSFLHNHGYFEAQVKISVDSENTSPFVNVHIHIIEGFFRRVKQVEVLGANAIPPERIRTTFKTLCMNLKNFVRGLLGTNFACYSKSLADNNVRYLGDLYAEKGYLQADIQVSHQFVPCDPKRRNKRDCAKLRVRVTEGPRVEVSIKVHEGQWTNSEGIKQVARSIFGINWISRLFKTNLGRGRWPNDETINTAVLRKATTFKDAKIVNALEVQKSVASIKSSLISFGYLSSEVTGHIRFQSDAYIVVQFDVFPGNPSRLIRRTISGNHTVATKFLQSQIQFRTRPTSIFNNGHVSESDMAVDKKNILALYGSLGFHDTKVTASLMSEDGYRLHLTYNIDEGKQYFVNSVTILGGIENLNAAAIRGFSNCKQGRQPKNEADNSCKDSVYFSAAVDADSGYLSNYYYENGYGRLASKTQIAALPNGRFDIEYRIEALPVPFEVTSVLFQGNTRTNLDALLRESGLPSSGPQIKSLNPSDIEQAISRLRQAGIFDRVAYQFVPVDGQSKRALLISVVERESLQVEVAASFSSDNLFAAYFGISESNLFGSMLRLNIDSDWGLFWGRRSDLSLGIIWPRIWGTKLYLQIQAPYLLYENELQRDPPQRHFEAIASAGLTYQFTEKFNSSLMYIFRLDKWEIPPSGNSFLSDPGHSFQTLDGLLTVLKEPSSLRGILRPQIQYLSLDNPFNPKNGLSMTASLEFSGKVLGADHTYTIVEFDMAAYATKWKITLASRLRVQRAFIGDPNQMWWILKYQSNFDTLGGDRSVRGYPQGDIGFFGTLYDDLGNLTPQQGYHPGNLSLLANVELRFPLFTSLPFGQIDGAVFTDFGLASMCQGLLHCSESSGKMDAQDQSPFGWSVGLGLRYVLPVGPISLDYAVAPLQAGTGIFDRQSRLHLMFGYAF